MLKKSLSLAVALAAFASTAPAALAYPGGGGGGGPTYGLSDSAKAKATVTLVQPISIHKLEDLKFGAFMLTNDTKGEIKIRTNGSQYYSQGITPAGSFNKYSAAKFEVRGFPGAKYSIQLPDEAKLYNKKGYGVLEAEDFTTDDGYRELNNDGYGYFYVGAELEIEKNTKPGHYVGEFTATVAYVDLNCID